MVISGTKVHDFCERVAFEVVKTKKGAKTPKNDPEVAVVCNDLEGLMISGGPIVKETVSRFTRTLYCYP